MATADSSDFRVFLQEEFLRRCRTNPRYSLRGFANTLRIDSSALSKILRGDRGLTRKMHLKLGEGVGLSSTEIQSFESYRAGLRRTRPLIQNATSLQAYQQMNLDTLAVIADWYHHAILELVKLKNFKPEFRWVAKRLGLTPSEVRIAAERLERVGLLRIHSTSWQLTHISNSSIDAGKTSSAARRLQVQVLEKALRALHEIPYEDRVHSSMTMAIRKENLPAVREHLKTARRKICQLLAKGGDLDEVYQLSLCLYPLTRLEKKGAKNEKRN